MDTLIRQVRRAYRWLAFQRYLKLLTWCWCGAFGLLAALATADWFFAWNIRPAIVKFVSPAADPGESLWIPALVLFAAGLAAGGVAAAVWTLLTRISHIQAAMEIDRRFNLKERVSSAIALDPQDRETPAGRALVADAAGRVNRLDVSDRFRPQLGRWSLLPLGPAAVASLLCLFLPLSERSATGKQDDPRGFDKQAVREEVAPLLKKISHQKKQAQDKGDLERAAEFDKLYKKIEQAADQSPNRREAAIELNDAVKDYQKQRKELGAAEDFKKQLARIRNFDQGPAGMLARAVKNGDFENAVQQIEKLKRQLKDGQLDEQQKQKLANQLDKMQRTLQDLANAAKNSPQAQKLKKQIREAQQSGGDKKAAELQKQLDQLPPPGEQSSQLQQLAEQLKQCANCLKNGDAERASQALDGMKEQLADLQQQLEQLQTVDDLLEQVTQAKNALLAQRQGGKQGQGQLGGQGQNQQGGRPGRGLGPGRGAGRRPETKNDSFQTVDSNVPGKTGRGAAVVIGDAAGPNIRGDIREAIEESLREGLREQSDPLDVQQLPKGYRKQVEEYFRSLREGE